MNPTRLQIQKLKDITLDTHSEHGPTHTLTHHTHTAHTHTHTHTTHTAHTHRAHTHTHLHTTHTHVHTHQSCCDTRAALTLLSSRHLKTIICLMHTECIPFKGNFPSPTEQLVKTA